MKLMVLDGNSIINRAFYGVRPLTTREGLHTNALFGFVNILQRFLDGEQPDAVCVAFDRHEPTFRHEADEQYKANRHGMPEELHQQMPILKEILAAMHIPCYDMAGYEADDLIGTISRRCEAANWDCVIVTGDRDALQLITDRTCVMLVSSKAGQTVTHHMDEAAFREKYGFAPQSLIDLKALMGDSSDNIRGVAGIGEKTATDLICRYETIDKLYAALPHIEAKPAVINKLTAGEDSARRSYFLAAIVTDAPLDFRPEDALCKPWSAELYNIFLRLEFTKFIERYHLTPPAERLAAAIEEEDSSYTVTVETPTTDADAARLLKLWRKCDTVALYALPDLSVLCVECEVDEEHGLTAILRPDLFTGDWDALLRALFSGDIAKVSHNVKDLHRALLQQGITGEGILFDTALAAYLLDATAGGYDLDRLFMAYCGAELPAPAHLAAGAFSPLGENPKADAALCSYTAAIAALYEILPAKLDALGLTALHDEMELPLCPVLAEMELHGFKVDTAALRDFGVTLRQRMEALEQEIYSLAGEEFNINSPKQLGVILFDNLQLPHGKKTKTGWSTNADILNKLRTEHPVVAHVLEYRHLAKLNSTYAEGLLKAVDSDDRIRTRFQMTVTATGRLSSAEPNLQNIPTRTEVGREIRRLFIPEKGNVLVDADYSQIELRLLAHIADDKEMQQAFLSGRDFHTVTAAKVFHVEESAVTPAMRSRAKAVNFGIIYGMSAFSLSQDINVSVAEAKDYIDRYFETYGAVRAYMDAVVAQGKERGYVATQYGRRRAVPELRSSNHIQRGFGERVALNMPIQGTAADVIKLAMVRVHDALKKENLAARLIMQVHDELIVECPEAEAETVAALLRREMEAVASFAVPLIAEAHAGENWLSAKG